MRAVIFEFPNIKKDEFSQKAIIKKKKSQQQIGHFKQYLPPSILKYEFIEMNMETVLRGSVSNPHLFLCP